MDTKQPVKRTRVRAYAPEFKAKVLADCAKPGASVAKVALAHRLNANMIHTWRRQASAAGAAAQTCDFVPLRLDTAPAPPADSPIRIELQRAGTTVKIAWPVAAAGDCAAWLRDWLR